MYNKVNGQEKFLFWKKSVNCPITIEPTKQFFNWEFNGKDDDAYFALEKIVKYTHFNTNNFQLHFN